MAKNETRVVKGIPYEVVEGAVILHKPEGDVKLPLEWGQNAYAVAYGHLTRKGGSKGRKSDGTYSVGNFTYKVDEDTKLMTVSRKNGETIGSLTLTDSQLKYHRNAAIKVILEGVE